MSTDQNTFQRIKAVVEHSSLSALQQREFLLLFAQTKEQALRPVLDLFVQDSTWVERLYENYEAKRHAIVTGSMDAWKDVVHKEQKVIAA